VPLTETDLRAEEVRPRRPSLTQQLLETIRIAAGETGDPDELEPVLRPEARALLRDALREGATDIHLDPSAEGLLVRLRVDGVVLDGATLDRIEGDRLMNQIKTLSQLNPTSAMTPEHNRVTLELDDRKLDLRVTVAPCLRGDKLSVRLLEPERTVRELTELGLSPSDCDEIRLWLDRLNGLFLVTGPTGSGKTTTLYALLQRLRIVEAHLVTLEDPVEFEVGGINQMQVDEARGLTFAEGIRSMLRLDPDYIMLGEIRDAATARAAMDAAASGNGLMSTLHSRDAASVVTVLRNYGLNDQEISANLSVVVSQRLVRTLCPHCRVKEPPDEDERRWLDSEGLEPPAELWHPFGCDHCRQVGYVGRTGVFEAWRVDHDDYALLLDHADERRLQQHLADKGHRFLLDDALDKVGRGVTAIAEVRRMGYGSWSQSARGISPGRGA